MQSAQAPLRRRTARFLAAFVTTVSLVVLGGGAAHAFDPQPAPVPNTGPDSGGTNTSTVVGQSLVQVAAGVEHSMGVGSDGRVYGWGKNAAYTFGNGMREGTTTPAVALRGQIPEGVSIIKVTPGWNHSVGLADDGHVYAWGWNNYGQLGDGGSVNSTTPVRVAQGVIPDGVEIRDIESGSNHTVALGSNGELYSWGFNGSGQLGDGTTANRNEPVAVTRGVIPAGVGIEQFSVRVGSALVLGSDGNVYGWGPNTAAQLGDGTVTNRLSPVQRVQGAIPEGVTGEMIVAGSQHGFMLGSDGNMYSWGNNDYGQLGNNSSRASRVPVLVNEGQIPDSITLNQLAAGTTTSLVLGSDGHVYGWGQNVNGALGDGSKTNRAHPVRADRGEIPDTVSITQVDAGLEYTLALGSDGNSYGWGMNDLGQLGLGSKTNWPSPKLMQRGQISDRIAALTRVSAGGAHSMGMTSDLRLYSWGSNVEGQLGGGSAAQRDVPAPVQNGAMATGEHFVQVASGDEFSLATSSDEGVYSWGSNSSGQLGDGTTDERASPVAVDLRGIDAGTRITEVGAGAEHALMLGGNNALFAFGNNEFGQLGDGSTTDRTRPVPVDRSGMPADVAIIQFSAGNTHNAVLGTDGSVYTWGDNEHGQLGDGSLENRTRPVPIERGDMPAGIKITQVVAGDSVTLGLGTDGNLYAWGENTFGQLGDGSTTDSATPVLVERGEVPERILFTQVHAGAEFTLALASDGQAYAWGHNDVGQLGNATTADSATPVRVAAGQVPDGERIIDAETGGTHTTAIGSDGNAYAWGQNDRGQLGDGSTENRTAPVLSTFAEIITGVEFGGSQATDVSGNVNGAVTAVTPAHPGGVVDVEVAWTLNGVAQPHRVRWDAYTYVGLPAFTTDPADQSVAAGNTASFSVVTSAPATVVWETSTDAGAIWNPVTLSDDVTVSADGRTLTVLGEARNTGDLFRASATNNIGTSKSGAATLTVVSAPDFTLNPSDETVADGNDAVFEVATEDPATVEWEFSADAGVSWEPVVPGAGVTVSANGLSLTVTGSVSNDGFKYRARASNAAGEVYSTEADLTVVQAPEFITHPIKQEVGSGSVASFTVEVTDPAAVEWEMSPDAGVSWDPVVEGSGVTVSADGLTLQVVGDASRNGYEYRAVASNIAGTMISDEARLTIVVTPGFVTNPTNQTVVAGQPATFAVVTDAQVTTLIWEVSSDGGNAWGPLSTDPSAVPSGDGLSITVTGSVANTGYSYRAVATNQGGTFSSGSATLTVVEAPAFTLQPQNQAVAVGGTADFRVTATEHTTVSWQVSDDAGASWNDVVPNADLTVSSDGLLLQVTGTAANDGFQYRAVASNLAGTAESTAATLTVVAEPVFTLEPLDQKVVAGNPAVFTVGTNAPATVEWEVSATMRSSWSPVAPGPGVTVSPDGLTLTVTGDQATNEHYYRAVASNIAGEAESASAQLTLVFEPEILSNPTDQTVGAGASAVFAVETDVAADVVWEVSPDGGTTWGALATDPSAAPSADGLALTVTGSAANNGFAYRAVVLNIAGSATSSAATLTVIELPVIVSDPANQTVAPGGTAVFTVTEQGASNVYWEMSADGGTVWEPVRLDPVLVPDVLGSTLELVADASMSGQQYRAVASNFAGAITSAAATLTVASVPGFVTNPANQTVIAGEEAVFTVVPDAESQLEWEFSPDQGATWETVILDDTATVSADGLTLTVTGSAANNGFQYRAVATNAGGIGTSGAATLTVISVPVFTLSPANQTVLEGTQAVFTVATDAPVPVGWEVSSDGGSTWSAVAPGGGISLSTDGLTLTVTGAESNNGFQFRAVATNAAGTGTSSAALLTVTGHTGAEAEADAAGANADSAGAGAGATAGASGSEAGSGASGASSGSTGSGNLLSDTGAEGSQTLMWVLAALALVGAGAGVVLGRSRKRGE